MASFYLPYVEDAIAAEPNVRIVCLKRPREEVIRSFCDWLDRVHGLPTNHWAETPAAGWYHHPIWTRIFPQYATQDREEGIGHYWDEYYAKVDELVRHRPPNRCPSRHFHPQNQDKRFNRTAPLPRIGNEEITSRRNRL